MKRKNRIAMLILLLVIFAAIPQAFAEEPYMVIFCYANTGCRVMYPLLPTDAKVEFIYTNLYQPPHIVYQGTKDFPFVPPAPQPYKQPAFNLFE